MGDLGCLTIYFPDSKLELSLENNDKDTIYNAIKAFMDRMFREIGYPDGYTISNEKDYVKLNSYLLGLFLAIIARTKYVELSESKKTSISVSIKLFKEIIDSYMREFPSYHIANEAIASYVQKVFFETFNNIILKDERMEITKFNYIPLLVIDDDYIKILRGDGKIYENVVNKNLVKEAYLIATDDY